MVLDFSRSIEATKNLRLGAEYSKFRLFRLGICPQYIMPIKKPSHIGEGKIQRNAITNLVKNIKSQAFRQRRIGLRRTSSK